VKLNPTPGKIGYEFAVNQTGGRDRNLRRERREIEAAVIAGRKRRQGVGGIVKVPALEGTWQTTCAPVNPVLSVAPYNWI
jgi:hypothetical protein